MRLRPMKATKGAIVKRFQTMRDVCQFLDVRPNVIYSAIKSGKPIKGWVVDDDDGGDEKQTRPWLGLDWQARKEPPPRYAEIFTRKPFSAVKKWEEV